MNSIQKFEIYFVRHGNTSGQSGTLQNACDLDLSPRGNAEIKLLARRFKDISFDGVFSSPLIRAVKTAAAVCGSINSDGIIEIMPELIENGHYPEYKGADISFLQSVYPKCVMCKEAVCQIQNGNFVGMAEYDDYYRAFLTVNYFLSRFGYGKKILVVSHGSFGEDFIKAAAGIAPGDFIFSLNNTSVTKLKFTSDQKKRISFANDVSHLFELEPDLFTEI